MNLAHQAILVAVLISSYGLAQAADDPCGDLHDPSGMIGALLGVSDTLPEGSLDKDVVLDAVANIADLVLELSEACGRISAQEKEISGLVGRTLIYDRLLESTERTSEDWKAVALKPPPVAKKRPWLACGIGPYLGVDTDADASAGGALACIIPLVSF